MTMSSRRRRGARRFGAVVMVAFAALLAGGAPAGAHSSLNETRPANGAVIAQPPRELVLVFNESVSTTPNSVRLVDSNGEDLVLQQPVLSRDGDTSTLSATVDQALSDGWYGVQWQMLSADGHPISGSFTFSVGAAAATVEGELPSDPSAKFRLAADVLRTTGYLVTLLAIGLLIGASVLRPVPALAARSANFAAIAAVCGLFVNAAAIVNNAVLLNGGSFEQLGTTLLIALQTTAGTSLMLRISSLFALCTAVLLFSEARLRKLAGAIAALAAAAMAVSYAMSGHASVVNWKWVAGPALVAHLLAGAAWLGAMPAVAWVFRARHRLDDRTVSTVADRFSVLATVSLGVVFVAGLALAVSMFEKPSQITTRYGLSLLAKLAAVAVTAGFGAYNHFVALPRLRASVSDEAHAARQAAPETGEHANTGAAMTQSPARRHLAKLLRLEALAVVVVAVLTGLLTTSAAPAAGGAHNVHQGLDTGHHDGALDTTALDKLLDDLEPKIVQEGFDGGELEVSYRPGRVERTNQFTITVYDASGKQVSPQAVSVSFTHPETGIGPLRYDAEANEDGTFNVATRDLGLAGTWQMTLTLRLSALRSVDAVVEVTMKGADQP